MLHSQYAWDISEKIEESKENKSYTVLQSEISKSIQMMFEVSYKAGKNRFYCEIPFVLSINASSISLKNFAQVVKDNVQGIILNDLASKNIDHRKIADLQYTLINQPEMLIFSFDKSIDKETLWNCLESSEISYHMIFDIPIADKISKRMIPKHIIFWNTKLNIYEGFTHQTFRYIDEGKEHIESMWSGKYNTKDQQVDDTFFDIIK